MKLKIENGELTLPENFSFEIEQNSAFFSEDGTSSVPATIPATPEDLAKLDYPTRVARQTKYINLFPTILSQGVFQKKGQLMVNSASKDGISCAIALEDSDFYAQYKDVNLKDLFSTKELTTYSTIQDWYNWLFRIYKGEVLNDLTLFPVATNYNEGAQYQFDQFQINNEPIISSSTGIWQIAWQARKIKEGDETVAVPDGYGIAPFLKLPDFIEQIFTLCGYTIGSNCFRTNRILQTLVLLHNCSDVICNCKINYSDLVPNKSISEILEWMRAKFMAQIVVHPGSSVVDIVLLEDILNGSFDKDLTGKLLGKLTHTFSRSSRVVMQSNTSLDLAAPAAERIEDLIAKYKALGVSAGGLGFNKATGVYTEYHLSLAKTSARRSAGGDSIYTVDQSSNHRLGTNYFNYDQRNSDESESISPADLVPAMVWAYSAFYLNTTSARTRYLMPYIGERMHRNTSLNNSEQDREQEIIICDDAGISIRPENPTTYDSGGRYYYGTTQEYDNTGTNIRNHGSYLYPAINLNNQDLFNHFLVGYNRVLRNYKTELSGQFDLKVNELMDFNMYGLKLYEGQKLLPKSLRYEVGKSIRNLEAKFLLVKTFTDGSEDVEPVFPEAQYRWELNDSQVSFQRDSWQSSAPTNPRTGTRYQLAVEYTDSYSTGEDDIFFLPPTGINQKTLEIERTFNLVYYESTYGTHPVTTKVTFKQGLTGNVWFDSVAIS